MDGKRRIYAESSDGHSILSYDADGRFRTWLGSEGKERGAFGRINGFAVSEGDSLLVIDGASGFVYLISPSGVVARTQAIPEATDAAWVTAADGIVVAADIRSKALAGYPLHVITKEGTIVRSFGSSQQSIRPRCTTCGVVRSGFAGNNLFWTAASDGSWAELWLSSEPSRLLEHHTLTWPADSTGGGVSGEERGLVVRQVIPTGSGAWLIATATSWGGSDDSHVLVVQRGEPRPYAFAKLGKHRLFNTEYSYARSAASGGGYGFDVYRVQLREK